MRHLAGHSLHVAVITAVNCKQDPYDCLHAGFWARVWRADVVAAV